ncbi:MAG: molecular chaperone DnaJ [Nitrospirae bacterium]|nr:MAG: molecular chaperone DnaJ [Nitrospirota bacterium]
MVDKLADYYEILGISRDATEEEIKKAYRRQALKYHPDRNPGDKEAEEMFKKVNEAYACLSDPKKRAYYDRYGTLEGFGGGRFTETHYGTSFNDIFQDFFGDFFSTTTGRRRRPRPTRGHDLRYDLEITLEEAFTGVKKVIEIPRLELCPTCGGTGANPSGRGPMPCPECHGTGELHFRQGFFSVSRTCGRCGGSGQYIPDPCPDCRGNKVVQRYETVSIEVPRGVDSGMRLKLSGKGEAGKNGGPYGDLYVVIYVKPHSLFERKGDDLYCKIPISFPQAALGGEVEVPTIDGKKVKLKIPAGTQPGKLFHIKGMGMPRLQGYGRGDLLVEVYIEVPKKLSQRQKELLYEFANISGDEVSPEGFVSRLKHIFSKEE